MDVLLLGVLVIVYGFGMFVWGGLSVKDTGPDRMHEEWLHGFRDGWEAAERFDDDVRIVWGGER